ncbi:MAG TPA: sensor domain-containing diguanylate cyclase, partial [Thiobacillus sp.]|nr:sensor domain-containing diguanylate cyclase [Thiobacillus sp.]
MINLPISTRLLLSYLLVAVLPLGGLAWVYLASFETSLRETLLANMAAIADKKAGQIGGYMAERMDDVQHLSRRAAIRDGLAEVTQAFRAGGLDAAAYREAANRLHRTLEESNAAKGFYDLLLIDAAGNVVFSLLREPELGTNLSDGPYRDSQLATG